jgi:putative membrane protein
MHRQLTMRAARVAAACFAVGACRSGDDTAAHDTNAAGHDSAAMAMGTDTMSAAGSLANSPLDDGQILAQLAASDQAEIAAGEMAQQKATHADVKAFARKLVTEHQAMMREGQTLAQTHNLPVQATAAPDSGMIRDAQEEMRELREMNAGADWDKEYLDEQIEMHEEALEFIDRALGSAQSADLRAHLQAGRTKVEAHLNEAKQLKDRID